MDQGAVFQSAPVVITMDKILRYAKLSNDFNPIHVDEEFAKKTPFKSVIAHGMLSLNILWELIIDEFGIDVLNDLEMDIRFRKPVKVNESIYAKAKIVEIKKLQQDDGYTIDVEVINVSKNEKVIQGQVTLRRTR